MTMRISFSQIKVILNKYGADDDIFEFHNNIVNGGNDGDDANIDCVPISSRAYRSS